MFLRIALLSLLAFVLIPASAQSTTPGRSAHVVLISIDGLHPDMYLDPGWPAPSLRELMQQGTYADHMKSVFPAYTYPSHTAMLTGALPARSGVTYNQPIGSHGEWNWFARYIKAPTLWQALRDHGLATAAVQWPATVGAPIDYNIPEIWAPSHPDDRISVSRKYATPGLVEAVERNVTGPLDSSNMDDNNFSLDVNAGHMAAYIFKTYKPAFLAVHFACVDGMEHEQGRDGDSVRLALATDGQAIAELLRTIDESGLKDSTTVLIVGDHGFSTIHTVMRPNRLIRDLPAKFIAAGGSAFLYVQPDAGGGIAPETSDQTANRQHLLDTVITRLNDLPPAQRKLFRIIGRKELDQMGADSAAILALTAAPGTVFSGSIAQTAVTNNGPGTGIQQNPLDGLFVPTDGGHHGYDPNIPDMYTGFIAAGAGIVKGGEIRELCVTDVAPLIARLLGVAFSCPDGKLVPGILIE
jgi:predicted AlkP superfamily pyrophosphatase or phosphodiesterase